jgi:hypothetical protein
MSKKTVIRTFQFRSSSNAALIYTTLLYASGEASCNCPAWDRRVAEDGSRSCKHLIAAGIAPIGGNTSKQDLIRKGMPAPPKGWLDKSAKHGAPAPVSKGINRRMIFED